MSIKSVIVISVLIAAFACTPEEQRRRMAGDPVTQRDVEIAMEEYDVEQYFPGNQKDTLLTNMVTYIYRRPAEATAETRTNPKFRGYFVKSAQRFEYVYHHMDDDGVHYYYLIRPARNLERSHRAVGGTFTTNENLELVTFDEWFNTTIMNDSILRKKGLLLFEEMIEKGNVDRYLTDQNLIEWPDHRLKYDKDMHEWRYTD